jgi:iron uptake system EfeUOB component EfeO/EfeM
VLALVAIAVLAAVGVFVGSALTPSGGGSSAGAFATKQLAGKPTPNPLAGRLKKVYGTDTPASRFGEEVAAREDQGTNLAGEKVSDLSPLSPRAFDAPVAEYRRYASRWVSHALTAAVLLRHALAAGDRAAARSAWESTWSDYLHLGAVYGLFGDLDQAIDGTPGSLRRGTSDPGFVGLHRIELGLWSGASPRSLERYGTRLQGVLARLHSVVVHVQISPLEYATRSHEIIEDAQRDLLSGTQVPWSGQGVLGTAAGLAATKEVFHTLEPLLSGRENTEGEVRSELLLLGGVLAAIRREHGGRYPSLSQLSTHERERLNGYLAGALTALEQMPGTLETESHQAVPQLPADPGSSQSRVAPAAGSAARG